MAKILNISLEDSLYQQVVDKANEEDRSVRKMVAMLVQRGLTPPVSTTPVPTLIPLDQAPLPVLPPNVAQKATPPVSQPVEKTERHWYESDPEYIELGSQIEEIDEQIASGELDEEDYALIIKERAYIQDRLEEIRSSKPAL